MDAIRSTEKWIEEQGQNYYGMHTGFVSAHEQVKKSIASDDAAIRMYLDGVLEPSDKERAGWSDDTRQYVETLESVIDYVMPEKA